MTGTIIFNFSSSWCNDWPEISIDCNKSTLWTGKIEKADDIVINFTMIANNEIFIRYLNKRNGPDIWDTKIQNKKIIEDQYCILTGLNINKSKCDWLIPRLIYNRNNGTTNDQSRGFMDLQGYFKIEFPEDVYKWIATNRRKNLNQTLHQSSLAYEDIYIPDSNYDNIQNILEDIQLMVDNI
jgi:hypothetical protein